MKILRRIAAGTAVAGVALAAATPASAQFYLKSRDYSGAVIQGDEPGVLQPVPGATPAERRAAVAWTLRAGLNVAALQCGFQPTLLSVSSYNAMLTDHKAELAATWDTLTKYFNRTAGSKLKGQNALDHFQTLTYSSFSTIQAQLNFCQTAAAIGRDAAFTPRGQFATLAEQRLRELRNSQTPWGEQIFQLYAYADTAELPRFDPQCWDKKGVWREKKCGAQTWPVAGTGVAALNRPASAQPQ